MSYNKLASLLENSRKKNFFYERIDRRTTQNYSSEPHNTIIQIL